VTAAAKRRGKSFHSPTFFRRTPSRAGAATLFRDDGIAVLTLTVVVVRRSVSQPSTM